MSEIEIISWALVALFLITITATIVGWQFIRKYEKLKLEFTSQRLQQFEEMLTGFIDDSANRDQNFHQERIENYKEFLTKMEQDYAVHTTKVDQLNHEFDKINQEIKQHKDEFHAINPQLKETAERLKDEDIRIKQLIEIQFELLKNAGEQYQNGFENLIQQLNQELTQKSVQLGELTESTHRVHNDKIKEYSSELCNEMLQLGKRLTNAQEESLKSYKERLAELAGTAEQGLYQAIKNHSLNNIEQQISDINIFQNTISEHMDKLDKNIHNMGSGQNQLTKSLEEIQKTLNALKDSKGLFKKLF